MGELEQKKSTTDPWWRPALLLFFQLSAWIGFPIIAAMFIGSWLDTRYGTAPWLYLLSVAFAFAVSVVGIVREGGKAIQQMEQLSGKSTQSKTSTEQKIK